MFRGTIVPWQAVSQNNSESLAGLKERLKAGLIVAPATDGSCIQRLTDLQKARRPDYPLCGVEVEASRIPVVGVRGLGVRGLGVRGQTEFQVNLKLGLTPRRRRYASQNRERYDEMLANRLRHGLNADGSPRESTRGPYERRTETPAIALPDANDPFVILGVNVRSTLEQVKAAYRRAVKRTHPDHGGSAAAFRGVEEAYRTILERHFRGAHYEA